jgi:hypothetical protein
LDASYISRLRRGVRNLPKNENYVPLMADYFAKHCVEVIKLKLCGNVYIAHTLFPTIRVKTADR